MRIRVRPNPKHGWWRSPWIKNEVACECEPEEFEFYLTLGTVQVEWVDSSGVKKDDEYTLTFNRRGRLRLSKTPQPVLRPKTP